MVLIAQMLLMSGCEAMIASYSSNVAVVVHDLMLARRGAPRFAHRPHPLPCALVTLPPLATLLATAHPAHPLLLVWPRPVLRFSTSSLALLLLCFSP